MFFKKLKQTNNNFGDINDVYISAYYNSELEKYYNSMNTFNQQIGKHVGDYTKKIRPLITGNSTQIMSNNKAKTQLELDAIELLSDKSLSIPSIATRKYNLNNDNIKYPDENKFNLALPNTSKVMYLINSDSSNSDSSNSSNTNDTNDINSSNDLIAIDVDNRCLAYDERDDGRGKLNVCYPVYKVISKASGAYKVQSIGWGVFNEITVSNQSVNVLEVDAKMEFEHKPYLNGFGLRGSKSVTLQSGISNVDVVDNKQENRKKVLVNKELILNGNHYGYILNRYPVLYNETSLINTRAGLPQETNDIPMIQSYLENQTIELNEYPTMPMLHQEQLLYYSNVAMTQYYTDQGVNTLNDIINVDNIEVSSLRYKYFHGNNTELIDEQLIKLQLHGNTRFIAQNNTIHLIDLEWKVIDHNFGTNDVGINLVKLFLSTVYGSEYSTYTSEMQEILDKVDAMLNDSVTYYPVYSRDKSTLISASIYYHFNIDVYNNKSDEIKKFVSRLSGCITYDVRASLYDDIEGVLNCTKGDSASAACIFPFMFDDQIKYISAYKIKNYAGITLPEYCNMVYSNETNKGYLVSPSMLHRVDPLRYCYDKTKFISDYDYDTELISAMYNGLSAEENGLYPIRASYTHACNYFRVNEIIEINNHPHIKVIDRDCNIVGGLSENCLDIILPEQLNVDMEYIMDRMLPISVIL